MGYVALRTQPIAVIGQAATAPRCKWRFSRGKQEKSALAKFLEQTIAGGVRTLGYHGALSGQPYRTKTGTVLGNLRPIHQLVLELPNTGHAEVWWYCAGTSFLFGNRSMRPRSAQRYRDRT